MTSISQARAMGIWQAIAAGLLLLQLLIATKKLHKPISFGSNVSFTLGSTQGDYISLGHNGKITQKFRANEESNHYLLTFNRSIVISFSTKFAGGNQTSLWQTHGVYLGVHGNRLLNGGLQYGGFEYGPAFPNNSIGGVLIDAESDPTQSPLNQWEILGTVKYITTNRNYQAPEGTASIELVAGKSSGIQTSVRLKKGSEYALACRFSLVNIMMHVLVTSKWVFKKDRQFKILRYKKKGAGTGLDSGWTIKAHSNGVTRISILSFATTKSKDGVLCGPVIDKVVLLASYGLKLQSSIFFVGIGFLATLVQIMG
ncbi:hypothetical protein MKW92_048027 [Papaver armeniacum]|nr:hypothetical protein MKW92_048027 [Papaver armeniacum]